MKRLLLLPCLCLLLLFLLPGCAHAKPAPAYELFTQDDFTVIKTPAYNITPVTIRSPLCSDEIRNLGYYGINAGFFNTVYKTKPDDADFISVSIVWSKAAAASGAEVCEYSVRDPAPGAPPYIPRGTLYLYEDAGKYVAGVISAESCDDLRSQVGGDLDFIYMIGGGNFYLSEYPTIEDWDRWVAEKYQIEGPLVAETTKTDRSGIGIKNENGVWYAYLAVSGTNGQESRKTLQDLRDLFISLGCSDAIYLDGDGSSQMRCADSDGTVIEKPGDDRYIWAMVRLINTANQ